MHSTSTPPRIGTPRLRADAFAAWAERQGLPTETAQAERIGLNRSILSRVRRGESCPSARFIAAVLTATGKKFEAMFEIAEAS